MTIQLVSIGAFYKVHEGTSLRLQSARDWKSRMDDAINEYP